MTLIINIMQQNILNFVKKKPHLIDDDKNLCKQKRVVKIVKMLKIYYDNLYIEYDDCKKLRTFIIDCNKNHDLDDIYNQIILFLPQQDNKKINTYSFQNINSMKYKEKCILDFLNNYISLINKEINEIDMLNIHCIYN